MQRKHDQLQPESPGTGHGSSKLALVRGLRDIGSRAAADWRALPAGAFARWAAFIAAGMLLCAALVWTLTFIAAWWAPRGLQAWDEHASRWVEAHGPLSFHDAILMESPGNLSYLIPLTLLAAVLSVRAGRPMLAISFVASYALARPLIILGWKLWDRPRPTFIAEGVASPPLHSFPSGHAVLAIAVWGLLAYLWSAASQSWLERIFAWTLVLVWVAMVSLARVRLGAHWVSDIIAGGVIGLVWLAVIILALRRAEQPSPR